MVGNVQSALHLKLQKVEWTLPYKLLCCALSCSHKSMCQSRQNWANAELETGGKDLAALPYPDICTPRTVFA